MENLVDAFIFVERWHDAKSAPPEIDRTVLTYSSSYGYVIGHLCDDGKWVAEHADYETGEPWLRDKNTVSFWMPLPEPPKQARKG